jgi:hypothetical protein
MQGAVWQPSLTASLYDTSLRNYLTALIAAYALRVEILAIGISLLVAARDRPMRCRARGIVRHEYAVAVIIRVCPLNAEETLRLPTIVIDGIDALWSRRRMRITLGGKHMMQAISILLITLHSHRQGQHGDHDARRTGDHTSNHGNLLSKSRSI